MISSSDLAAIFHRLAHDIEAMNTPPAPDPPLPPAGPKPDYDAYWAAKSLNEERVALGIPVPDPVPPASPPPPSPEVPKPTTPAPASPAQPKPMIDLDTIKGVQQAFNSIRPPNYAKLEENGVHDAVMTWALKEFQATAGIPTTGQPDKITIDTLHKAIFGKPRT
jgi:hypothetical protein